MIFLIVVISVLNLLAFALFLWLFFSGRLVLRTKKVVVVDRNKVERIHLDPESSEVRVFGKVFQRRSPASGLVLFNTKGDETGGFAVLDDGTVSVTIDSYEGDKISERVSMFHMGDGDSGFVIKDIDNQIRMKAQLNKDDVLEIKMFDKNGNEQRP